jgi:aryl-alcohol dehydrogenase-like predicted oxidoreductase
MAVMTRVLGRSGISVSAMGLGCWAIGGPFNGGDGTPAGWGVVDDAESTEAIQRGLELGITFFDTADAYGTGHSELVLGRALGTRRKDVAIATKFGAEFLEGSRQLTGARSDADYIRWACDASLRRLNTDVIDLYQFHLNDYPADEAAVVRDTLEGLVATGKIRWYAWSTDNPAGAEVFAQGAHCTAVQHQMNVLEDSPAVLSVAEKHNLASINRGPLAMGLLTGKYNAQTVLGGDDVRGDNAPGWMQYYKDGKPNPEWMAKLDAVRQILTSGGRSLSQGALAWLWARSPNTLPIPGFRTVKQVEENCAAMNFGPLTPEQMLEIEQVLGRDA